MSCNAVSALDGSMVLLSIPLHEFQLVILNDKMELGIEPLMRAGMVPVQIALTLHGRGGYPSTSGLPTRARELIAFTAARPGPVGQGRQASPKEVYNDTMHFGITGVDANHGIGSSQARQRVPPANGDGRL